MLLIQGSLKLRLSAARLCEKLLPQAPPEMVQVTLLSSASLIRLDRRFLCFVCYIAMHDDRQVQRLMRRVIYV